MKSYVLPGASLRKTKAEIVLKALQLGQGVPLFPERNNVYLMDGNVGFKGTRYTAGQREETEEEVFLPFEYMLGDFLQDCEQLADDEIFLIGAQNAMIEMNKTRERT